MLCEPPEVEDRRVQGPIQESMVEVGEWDPVAPKRPLDEGPIPDHWPRRMDMTEFEDDGASEPDRPPDHADWNGRR